MRAAVASNPHSSPAAVDTLIEDPDPDVRNALAHRLNLPADHMRRLVNDEDEHVGPAARRQLPTYLAHRFGIEPDNTVALTFIAARHWWTLTADSREIEIARRLSGERA